jgi:aminopeptidase YwaD
MLLAKCTTFNTVALTALAIALMSVSCSDEETETNEVVSQAVNPLTIEDVAPVYDANNVQADIEALVGLGPRVAGSAVERRAAEMIRTRFENFGLSVSPEDFPVTLAWNDNCGSLLKFKDDAIKPIHLLPMTFSPHAAVTAPIVHVDLGYPADYPVGKSGYIALIRRGVIPFAFKAQYAYEAGAVAAVVYEKAHIDGELPNYNAGTPPIPIANITWEDGSKILDKLAKKPLMATMHINTDRVFGPSRQVVATMPGTVTTHPTLYMTAHYDSAAMRIKMDRNGTIKLNGSPKNCPQSYGSDPKKGSPGADDNASGVAAMIEAARVLKGMPPMKATVKFIAFSGEEVGLSGSLAYVLAHRTEIDTLAIGVINLDMVGAGKYLLYGNASSPPTLMDFAYERASTISDLLIPTGLPQSSDHAAFEWRGVPAMALTRMIGEPQEPILFADYPYYHQPTDTMDKISVGLVESAGEFATLIAHDFADQ